MFEQHLTDYHGQDWPDSRNTETGEINQTLDCQCPLSGPGHVTSAQCRIRTISGRILYIRFDVHFRLPVLPDYVLVEEDVKKYAVTFTTIYQK